jgi:formylglycine-generating enzyme required for sulfatase activity
VNSRVPEGQADHPVVWLSRDDAVAFTEWLAEESGRAFRLCTVAEWEKACRGTSGLIYPWGDTFRCQQDQHVGGGRLCGCAGQRHRSGTLPDRQRQVHGAPDH